VSKYITRSLVYGQYYSNVPYRTWLKAALLGAVEEKIWLCLFLQTSVVRRFKPSLYTHCTIKQIADYCALDRYNVAKALEVLEGANLIEITDTTVDGETLPRRGRTAQFTIELKLPSAWRSYYGVLGAGRPEIGDRVLGTSPVMEHFVKNVPVAHYAQALNLPRLATHIFRAQLLAASCETRAIIEYPVAHLLSPGPIDVSDASIKRSMKQIRDAKLDAGVSVKTYCKKTRNSRKDVL
jgi:hypothetical protein